ncbi:hypothetical protein PVAND_011545 [Polypedilum vanderplanki]|uniref:DNA mismatch repair proteins mutS family domain-containing protein n=1 Tax=Polypedilum vanderplanki TaxID=319348 RepID=A0A9J6CIY3_POLVA|nr:hypothetical protein PVAND_011545 [Polypedilum vanderplanki]
MSKQIQKALNLDQKSQINFIEFYQKITEKTSEDTLVFRAFDRGDFYSIHGKDINIALKTSIKSSIVTKMMCPQKNFELKYASLNRTLAEKMIRELLLIHFYRVEVYTCKRDDFSVKKGSPGNLVEFEDILTSDANEIVFSNLLVSVVLSTNNRIGLCSIDVDESTIQVTEFEDSDFFMNLEACLVVLAPKEIILPSVTKEYSKIGEILNRNRILSTVLQKADFVKSTNFLQDLAKVYRFSKGQQKNVHLIPEVKMDLAMGALAAAFKYIGITKDESNDNKFSISNLNFNQFVRLDTAAFSALNLFPSSESNSRSSNYKTQSVVGVLDCCKTNQGKRLLRQWIKQPLKNINMIRQRLDVVQCFVENKEVQFILHNQYLNILPDVLLLTNKLLRKRGSLSDVYKIYQVVSRIPDILKLLKNLECNAINSLLFTPLNELKDELHKILEMVLEIIDGDALKKGLFLVRASFDDDLNEIKKNMNDIEAKMNKETKSSASKLGLEEGSTLKLDYVSHLSFFLRASRKEDQTIRKNKQFEIIDTARGYLRFTTAKLKELNVEYNSLKASYEEHQKMIVAEICKIIVGYSLPLTNLNHCIATLDVFVSFAHVVDNSPGSYVRPEIFSSEEKRILQIEELRHPCLECQDIDFIPNDVNFIENESELLIITGANTCGKSTYIRSIGIAVLLAHIGMFVPCTSAKISMCDSILARIGAADDIQKNLSTFAVEMCETAAILRTATKNSLIIIDELGRGTSTFEGLGLAWSISEHLAKNIKCFTLFATHFHEITTLENQLSNVKNYHLASEVKNDKLLLLFQVIRGPVLKSYGIHVADIAHLPESVVVAAKSYLKELEANDVDKENSEKLSKIERLLKNIETDKNLDIDLLSIF